MNASDSVQSYQAMFNVVKKQEKKRQFGSQSLGLT
jgi:hypothetical protein